MAKKKPNPQLNECHQDTEFGRGEIKDNALKAVVTSQLFRTRVVKAKKGKGSFNRKAKHRGKEPYSKFSLTWILNRAFLCLKLCCGLAFDLWGVNGVRCDLPGDDGREHKQGRKANAWDRQNRLLKHRLACTD